MVQGKPLRTRLLLGGTGVIGLALIADLFYRPDFYADPAKALPASLGGGLIMLAVWYVISGVIVLNKPLTQRGPQIYWGGSVVTALLAGLIPLFAAAVTTSDQIDRVVWVIATGGALVLGLWALLHWRWFMAQHWLGKLVLGPWLVLPLAIPARVVAYVGALAIFYLSGLIE
jgi:hypothetical protein